MKGSVQHALALHKASLAMEWLTSRAAPYITPEVAMRRSTRITFFTFSFAPSFALSCARP